MKSDLSHILFIFLIGLSISTQASASKKWTIYAGTISNKNFVVGAKNPGTGLFIISEDGNTIKNIGFNNMRTFSLEVFPDMEDGLIYCSNGNGFFVTKNNGKKWRVTTGWEITEILEVAAVAKDPKIVYIGSAYGLYKSIEFGENFTQLTNRFVTCLKIDNQHPELIYLGQEDGLYISKNSGKQFTKTANLNYTINAIDQDPNNPNQMYLGTEDDGIFTSQNRGNTWKQVSSNIKSATIYELTIDRNNPSRIFAATFKTGVLHSNDNGKTWLSLTKGLENIPIYGIIQHPDHSNILYVATANRGIFQSKDHGETWKPFVLDGTHVFDIEIK